MFETTFASSVLISALILLRGLFKGRLNLRLQYALWLLVAVRLLLPLPLLQSPASVLNVLDLGESIESIGKSAPSAQSNVPDKDSLTVPEGPTGIAGNEDPPTQTAPDNTQASGFAAGSNATNGTLLHTVWLSGAAATAFWFVAQNSWFSARLRKTRQKAEMPNSRLPVYLSRHVKSPCLFGLKPAIYIPPNCLADCEALRYILAHEETHYKHGDNLWAYLRCICLALHWFNPLVWWAAVLSRRDCEMACDESTLSRIGDEHRKAYGNTLIDMIERQAKPADLLLSATTMSAGESAIKERITMIAQKPRMLLSTLLVVVFLLTVTVSCTFTGAKGQAKITDYPNPVDGEQWGQTFTGFTSDEDGWFVGSPGIALGASENYVYLTHDGGKTWKETGNVNDKWPRVLTCAAFADSDTGYLCFRYDIENLGPVYQTADGGQSWNRLDIPELANLVGDGVGEVRSIEFDGSGYGKIEFYFRLNEADEGATQTLVSADRGQTWQSADEEQKATSQAGSNPFSESSGNIHDYMPQLLAGEAVSDYELLPCLENFTHATWLELHKAYDREDPDAPGGDWWNALFLALRSAAIGRNPADSEDQSLRDYYIGKAYLASDGAWSEGLADIVMAQWTADPALYSSCLNEIFPSEESYALRQGITYSIRYWHDSPFGLLKPIVEGRAYPGAIYLGAYPVGFPFCFDIAEKSRETYRAESYGQVTVVESDNLQVTYLNPADGVYTIITLRTKENGYQAAGVKIGDTEELLLAHPWPDELRKVDKISYDDEAWFGGKYDHAYAYTPEDSTKSVVFIIRNGSVSGIEIVNGLDGPMY